MRACCLARLEFHSCQDSTAAFQGEGFAGKRVTHAREVAQGSKVGVNVGVELGGRLATLPLVPDDEEMGFVRPGWARQMDDARRHDEERIGCHCQRQGHLQDDQYSGHLVSPQRSNDRAELHEYPGQRHEGDLNC